MRLETLRQVLVKANIPLPAERLDWYVAYGLRSVFNEEEKTHYNKCLKLINKATTIDFGHITYIVINPADIVSIRKIENIYVFSHSCGMLPEDYLKFDDFYFWASTELCNHPFDLWYPKLMEVLFSGNYVIGDTYSEGFALKTTLLKLEQDKLL
jgi:hypothetical protein